ncbi:endonuclease III [Aeoliella sp. SH292]|uniref:endonuclease III n=1 Tax=Aeoliella sp. SH292 TaxID=3454464 RepID=UPI003F9B5A62
MAKKSPASKKPAPLPSLPIAEGKKQAARVIRRLEADYPDAECALVHGTAFQLLIATILSAQCTDERVNIVTKDLFAQYPTAADIAAAPIAKLEKIVQSTGFFRAKAKNIKACSQGLVDHHGGEVPQDLDALVVLPGVGRKTANVVLGTAFGIPTGVVVDTHVGRLTRRLGLTSETDAVKVERDLMQIVPKKQWIDFSHRLIHHGRAICNARKPKCDACSMRKFCPQIGV